MAGGKQALETPGAFSVEPGEGGVNAAETREPIGDATQEQWDQIRKKRTFCSLRGLIIQSTTESADGLFHEPALSVD